MAFTLASIHDTKNFNTENFSLSQDPNELWERGDNRGVSDISNKVFSLLVSYPSDRIEPFKFFKVKMRNFRIWSRGYFFKNHENSRIYRNHISEIMRINGSEIKGIL